MNGDYTIIPRSNRIEDTLNELASIMINFRINKHNFKIFSQIFSRFKIYGSNRNMKFPDDYVDELYAIFFQMYKTKVLSKGL